MNRNQTFTALVLVFALSGAAFGQQFSTSNQPVELPPPVPNETQVLALSLGDAYQMALRRNLGLQVGRYDVAKADAAITEQAGIFDPNLSLGINGDWGQSPAATQLAGANVTEGRNANFNLGLGLLMPTGTSVDVSSSTTRSETNSTFFFLTPRWQTDLTVSLNQPLLQGFGTLVNRSTIIVARNTRSQTAATFAIQVIDTLRGVEDAYWDLVAARSAVEVRQQSLELAQQLLSETREWVKVGTSAPIDTIQSEATVAARLQELITARNAADNAEDALKAVLGFDQPDEWDVQLQTADALITEQLHPDLGEAISTALENRPEIHQQLLAMEVADLYTKVARNGILPKLDLQATYGWGGLGGDLKIVDPDTGRVVDTIRGGFDDARRQLTDRDFPHWTLGVTFSVPLGNNQAEARLAQRRFERDQAFVRLNALKQQIIREVRVAVRATEDGAANIDAATAARKAAERNQEAEETKFKNGLSTNYQVLQIQDDLAVARLTELQARAAYRKALVGYRYATGTLLDSKQVAIVDPDQPEIPHDYWKNVRWLQFVDFKGDGAAKSAAPTPDQEEAKEEDAS